MHHTTSRSGHRPISFPTHLSIMSLSVRRRGRSPWRSSRRPPPDASSYCSSSSSAVALANSTTTHHHAAAAELMLAAALPKEKEDMPCDHRASFCRCYYACYCQCRAAGNLPEGCMFPCCNCCSQGRRLPTTDIHRSCNKDGHCNCPPPPHPPRPCVLCK
ncbi:hypothetical protein BS78_10G006000 [Paspalum vaginatum]|nr:hypothetical protein BS78_10G006000 [Paspalum vaginatum]